MYDFTKTNKYKTIRKRVKDPTLEEIFCYIEMLEAQIVYLEKLIVKNEETAHGNQDI